MKSIAWFLKIFDDFTETNVISEDEMQEISKKGQDVLKNAYFKETSEIRGKKWYLKT